MQGLARFDAVMSGAVLVAGVAVGLPDWGLWALFVVLIGHSWWAGRPCLNVTLLFSALLCGHHGVVVCLGVPVTLAKVGFLNLFLQLLWTRKLERPSWWLVGGFSLFLGAMMLSGASSQWPRQGVESLLSMFLIGVLVVTVASSFHREQVSQILHNMAAILVITLVLYVPEGLAGVWEMAEDSGWRYRSAGPLGHPNTWAMVLLAYFPVLLTRQLEAEGSFQRWVAIGLVTLVPLVVLQTTSRGSILVLCLMVIVLGVLLRDHLSRLWPAFLLFLPLSYVFLDWMGLGTRMQTVVNRRAEIELGYWSIDVRLRIVEYGIEAWRAHPWTGVGVDNSMVAIESLSDHTLRRRPHNSYLLLLMEQGVVGFVAFCTLAGFVIVEWRRGLGGLPGQGRRWCVAWLPALGAILGLALFGDLLNYPLFWLLIALSIADLRSAID